MDDSMNRLLGQSSVRVETDEAFPFAFLTPPSRSMNLDASQHTRLGMFLKAHVPASNLLPTAPDEWIHVEIPLAGGGGFARTIAGGGTLTDVDYVELQTDTWDHLKYTVWIDGLTFF
jgi:hypothetical protein